MKALFVATFRREWLLAWRSKSDVLLVLAFFVLVAVLFPFGVGAEEALLRRIAPGVLWVTALLALLLPLPRLFEHDWRDGTLEQVVLSPEPMTVWLLAKLAAHWTLTVLPLMLLSPLLAMMYAVEAEVFWLLPVTLAVGTPGLLLLGAIGAALTLGVRAGATLLALLVLPLYVPVLIFAVDAIEAARAGLAFSAQLALLGAGTLVALALAPWACSAALRLAAE